MILRRKRRNDAEVPLSPLIDCVFLLLIFFLVTTMLKKTEKQIPVVMPDSDLALAVESDDEVLTLGVDSEGDVYLGRRGTTIKQMITYEPLGDLARYLQQLAAERGVDTPIQLAVDRVTKTQRVIELLDIFQVQGFDNVFVRIREGAPGEGD
ncbi:MAG: biopolymer transporter ExbD [Kiritimatiellae bacterium]|jgi:biopolymer transport protein ExbD|nr:biopolymer transporter ExbD [Kiritimatiellia bacterium]